jgi:hypothetical protein
MTVRRDTMPTSETKQHLAAWDNVKRLMSRHPAIEQTALTAIFGTKEFPKHVKREEEVSRADNS